VAAALLIFVLYPTVRVLGYPKLEAYGLWLAEPRFQRAALDSLVMLILSTASATAIGFIFAYAMTRSRLPLQRLWRVVCLLPLFSPPFMVAFGYLMLLGRNGLITHGLFAARVTILGWPGLWLAQTISFFPVAALVIEQELRSLPPSFDQAARNLGAGAFQRFWTVTLPLALPGVAAAALMVAILVLADFGNPIMIAGDFSVLATEAWLRVQGWADLAGAAVLGTFLLVPSLLLFWLQRAWAKDHAYVTVTGKASSLEPVPSPKGEQILLVTLCLAVSAVVLAAYAALVLGAVVKGWGYDWTPTWRWLSQLPERWAELSRSLAFSLAAGAASAFFAMAAAYLTTTRKVAGRRILDLLCMLPAALPGVFVGIGYSIAFNRPPIDLYGTAAIIILSLMFWNISPGYQTGVETLKQIAPSLGEAASNLGAGSLRRFLDLYLPLLRGPFLSAFILGFIRSITTLSVIVFVETSSNSVATFTIMNLVGDGYYGDAAALATALLILSFAAVGLARTLFPGQTRVRS
jgi:iron(III) transport system permease protein